MDLSKNHRMLTNTGSTAKLTRANKRKVKRRSQVVVYATNSCASIDERIEHIWGQLGRKSVTSTKVGIKPYFYL